MWFLEECCFVLLLFFFTELIPFLSLVEVRKIIWRHDLDVGDEVHVFHLLNFFERVLRFFEIDEAKRL